MSYAYQFRKESKQFIKLPLRSQNNLNDDVELWQDHVSSLASTIGELVPPPLDDVAHPPLLANPLFQCMLWDSTLLLLNVQLATAPSDLHPKLQDARQWELSL